MKHDYLISYYDCFPSFLSDEGSCIDVFGGAGWYVQVSEYQPWGPFESQKEAIESLLIEWERFEDGYWKEDEV